MYSPPLATSSLHNSSWSHRASLLRARLAAVDSDVVCLQEVSPVSFETDFDFMASLGYDGKEMYRKGRFRPATFWKTSRCTLASPPVHKDRTLLTAFRRVADGEEEPERPCWFILNCHLQAGPQAGRRLRQIHEGVRAVMALGRKLGEDALDTRVALVVCGDLNGGAECAAVRYLEDGYVDENFREDGEVVSSNRKELPLERGMTDAAKSLDREPPPTMVVAELISLLTAGGGGAYEDPQLSGLVLEKLRRIYNRLATCCADGGMVMEVAAVEGYLSVINRQVGRGSEFREAARQMGWREAEVPKDGSEREPITIPVGGVLSFEGFTNIYQAELKQGKFWGIAHDLAVLGETLPDAGVFACRYDRMYCSSALEPTAVMDFTCSKPCPNETEPSDHLPVAASFKMRAV